jgi:Bifunctional DNA primase/polymerase, N-terminal
VTEMLDAALELAGQGWSVLPCHELAGDRPKAPYSMHGYNDASTDPTLITVWWTRWPAALIGVRVDTLLCFDIDPRHDGSLGTLEVALGPLPVTLTGWSGRDDGGRHLFFHRPPGVVVDSRLPRGVDLKQAGRGYTIAPPSLHPDTGKPYWWEHHPVAELPASTVRLLRRPEPVVVSWRTVPAFTGVSVADAYSAGTSWMDVLGPHGWICLDHDPDMDGARWRHAAATAAHSATVRHGCLFVYTSNTPLPVTTPGSPVGLTRFRAHALLDHAGNLSGAARALRDQWTV